MTDSSDRPPWWRAAAAELWRSKWTRALAIIFVAFEIYNTAVLPAIRGTFETMKAKSDADIAKADAAAATATVRLPPRPTLEELLPPDPVPPPAIPHHHHEWKSG
ncbi:hypothetical protein [Hyphomicrobium sp.]|jgi:hypothetical protein|uniref:hypothetical protein n=1 Tax=Hyphomicrobium sp. TaxID=82 RepID=UPI003566ABF8